MFNCTKTKNYKDSCYLAFWRFTQPFSLEKCCRDYVCQAKSPLAWTSKKTAVVTKATDGKLAKLHVPD